MWVVTDFLEVTWDLTVHYPGRWLVAVCGWFIRADGPPGVNFRSHRMMDRKWWGP